MKPIGPFLAVHEEFRTDVGIILGHEEEVGELGVLGRRKDAGVLGAAVGTHDIEHVLPSPCSCS